MKINFFKKIAVAALVVALLVPTIAVGAAGAAERVDGSKFPSPLTSQDDSATTTNTSSTSKVTSSKSTGDQPTSKKVPHSVLKKNFTSHNAINGDVKGWLYVPGTNMNFPIVQGKNNIQYLNRTWSGTDFPNNNWRNYAETAQYLDHRVKTGSDWSKVSKNIVVFGHNWSNLKTPFDIGNYKNHKMFAQLASYNNLEFAQTNPYIYYTTGELEGIYKVFAVGYTETNPKNFPYVTPNPNDEQFKQIINEWSQRSFFNFDVDIRENDHIITLTTCTREFANVGDAQRYTVVARKLRPGESDTDPVTVTKNPKVKGPLF